jgi:alpha-1,3-rhamnosyltransferase
MSENQPLVSIIVPSYNHEKFVMKTIESIVNQTYKNFELFVIDDGSRDNSQSILLELSKKYNFYFEPQSNMGIVKTINKLSSLVKGKYITNCASDDAWTLDKLEIQVAFMEKNPEIGACFGNSLLINEHDEILPYYFQRFHNYKLYEFRDILGFDHPLRGLTAMYRKSVFDDVGYYNEEFLAEDIYLWLKIANAGYKLVILKNLMGYYRRHGANYSKNNKLLFKERIKLLNQYKGKEGYSKGLYRTYRHYYLHCLLNIIPKGYSPILR